MFYLDRTPSSRTEGESEEERPQSRGAPIIAVLIMLVCCGLPILVLSAGSLAFLSAVTGSVALLLAGIVVVALVAVGVAIRQRNKSRRTKPGGGA